MTTIADVLSSFKEEISARYRSPLWGPMIFSFIGFHWQIALFLLLERPRASEAILFIQQHCSWQTVASSTAFAVVYVIAFPWFEWLLSKATSSGTRKRNAFQIQERAKEIESRKVIAQQEAETTELALKNRKDQSKLYDIELAKSYQTILAGESFQRWLKDLPRGGVDSNLSTAIYNYLIKVDSIEGKFINPDVEDSHREFITSLSLLNSTLNDGRITKDEGKLADLEKFCRAAGIAQQEYRKKVRELLGI